MVGTNPASSGTPWAVWRNELATAPWAASQRGKASKISEGRWLLKRREHECPQDVARSQSGCRVRVWLDCASGSSNPFQAAWPVFSSAWKVHNTMQRAPSIGRS